MPQGLERISQFTWDCEGSIQIGLTRPGLRQYWYGGGRETGKQASAASR